MLKTSEELTRVASGQGVYRVVARAIFNWLGASRHVSRSGVRWPKQISTLKNDNSHSEKFMQNIDQHKNMLYGNALQPAI